MDLSDAKRSGNILRIPPQHIVVLLHRFRISLAEGQISGQLDSSAQIIRINNSAQTRQAVVIAGPSASRVIAVQDSTGGAGQVSGSVLARSPAHGQSRRGERGMRLGDGMLPEMEDRGRQHRGGVAVADARHHVVEVADAA